MGNRQIHARSCAYHPGAHRDRDLFTPEQVVLDARKHTAPVTAIESFVDHSTNFHVYPFAVDDFVIYLAQQFQAFGLISRTGNILAPVNHSKSSTCYRGTLTPP